MLPILRTISVGGVLLAITILALALIPPGRSHIQFAAADAPARGALIDQREHPEWRQFLLLAALRRAEELDRLRTLPDASSLPEIPNVTPDDVLEVLPLAATETESKVAGLPLVHEDTESEDVTGATNVAPTTTMAIDIGEASSSELPVGPVEEKPPVARSPLVDIPANVLPASDPRGSTSPPVSKVSALATPEPEQVRPVIVIRKRSVRHRAKPQTPAAAQAQIEAPPPFNLIQAFFAALAGKTPSATEPAAGKTNSSKLGAKPRRQATTQLGAQ
jgi:hypothetical protein